MQKGKGFFNLETTYEKAVSTLASLSPAQVSANSGVPYDIQNKRFCLSFLDRDYHVEYPAGNVKFADGEKASLYTAIIILHYLTHARGISLTGEWISFKELPGGQIYTEPFEKRAINPFLKTFAHRPADFVRAAVNLGGEEGNHGDHSAIIYALPRVPVKFVLWHGDEEFPATATILYDRSAPAYLPTEDYAHLPGLVLKEMKQKL